MNPSAQAAIDAANQGNKNKAIELIKQALTVNPSDVDMLLAFATIVDEPTRKRQILNRVLSLEATHKYAREMLLEMDRAELRAHRSQPVSAPVSIQQSKPQMAAPSPEPAKSPLEKPLVFRYSTVWLVVLYLFTTIFCCAGVLAATQSVGSSLPSLMLALLFGLTALSASSKVEVNQAAIRTSALFGSHEIKWNEIAKVSSNPMRKKLELVSNQGKSVKVSTQVKGYPVLVELLRQKRPDLFSEAASASMQGNVSVG